MVSRCTNPASQKWLNYGARGIKVCERWKKFVNFVEDMGIRPGGKLSIDRINNDGNYEPGNVRWATWFQQCRNKRTNKLVNLNGERVCMVDAARITGINITLLNHRLKKGWSMEKVIRTPIQKYEYSNGRRIASKKQNL